MSKYDPPAQPTPASKDGRPDCVRNVADIPPEAYEREKDGIAGIARDIGAAVGTRLLGVDLTEIPPGKKSSHLHSHSLKEEFFFVVGGRCRLKLGEKLWELKAGDAVSRPAGTGVPHQFDNPFAEPCSVLMFGLQAGKGVEDVVDWPEIGRKLVLAADGTRKLEKA